MRNRYFISNFRNFAAAIAVTAILANVVFAYTVNDDGDNNDFLVNDGVCETASGNGLCSLRAAVDEANGSELPGADTIDFNLPGGWDNVIDVGSTYSITDDGVSILNTSGDDVGIDSHQNFPTPVFDVNANDFTMDGDDQIYIYSHQNDAIKLNDGFENAEIREVYVGLDADENTGSGQTGDGIKIESDEVLIDDVVSSGNNVGVNLGDTAQDVTIQNSKIGTDSTGSVDKKNSSHGIHVTGSNPVNLNEDAGGIGGEGLTIDNNVISYNDGHGVTFTNTGGISGDVNIQNNYIGTDASGENDQGNLVGISSNPDVADGVDWVIDNNVVSGSDDDGIRIQDGNSANISNNKVGFNEAGDTAIKNGGSGIKVDATDITLQNNVVGNSDDHGIHVSGEDVTTVDIKGNNVGINASGTAGNFKNGDDDSGDGIRIESTNPSTAIIGGTNPGDENVVSYNDDYPIYIGNGVTDATINGNFIGVYDSGSGYNTAALNGRELTIDGDNLTNVTIGGPTTDDRNVISGGVRVNNAGLGTGDVLFQNNYSGIGEDGSSTVSGSQSGLNGVVISDGNNIDVKDNVISSAGFTGLMVDSGTDLEVKNNKIGTSADGLSCKANYGYGVSITGGTATNVEFEDNVIACNDPGMGFGTYQVSISSLSSNTTPVSVKGNYIGVGAGGKDIVSFVNGSVKGIRISEGYLTFGGDRSLGEGNVVSGHTSTGVILGSDVTSADIFGNIIGLSKNTGSGLYEDDLGNEGSGLQVANLTGLTNLAIGGAGSLRNIISGNDGAGILVQSLNAGAVVDIKNNYIGTDETGTTAIANNYGIEVFDDNADITIGGNNYNDPDTRNVVSGNKNAGVFVGEANGIKIRGNYIGLGSDGEDHDIGNVSDTLDGSGIYLADSGGAVDGSIIENNLTADNEGSGITIDATFGSGGMDFSGGYIQNNVVGLDINDDSTPNSGYGLYVDDSSGTNISNLLIGGSENTFDTSNNYGIYLNEVDGGSLTGGYSEIPGHNNFTDPDSYTWQYILSGEEQLNQCNDGVDNDNDGLMDAVDPGCNVSPFIESDTTGEGGVAAPPPAPPPTPPEEEEVEEEIEEVEEESEEAEEEPEVPEEEPEFEAEVEEGKEIVDRQFDKAREAAREVTKKMEEATRKKELSEEAVKSAIEEYEKKDVKKREVPEEFKKVADVVSGEDLSEEEIKEAEETVKNVVNESVEEAISRTMRTTGTGTVSVKVDKDKFVEVNSVNDVEVVLGRALSPEKLNKKKEEVENEGKELLVVDERSNFDNDELSDVYQISRGLPLFDNNPDEDKHTNAEEIYFGLDPLTPDDIPEKARVTNIDRLTTGGRPSFRISGEAGATCDLILISENGQNSISEMKEKMYFASVLLAQNTQEEKAGESLKQIPAASFTIGDDNKAEVNLDKPLADDLYYALVNCGGETGEAVKFEVNKKKSISTPKVEIEENIVRGSADPGMTVFVTWKSVILSSVVLSDASQGEFEIDVPELPEGDHEVVVYALDEDNSLVSNVSTLLFGR
ncbi:hypothetical protein GF366_03790 [Candidatus Peregrinibacteria bacterium]|nr:hypothetical protein [Candidatus Peregrinibacteria bacterium]